MLDRIPTVAPFAPTLAVARDLDRLARNLRWAWHAPARELLDQLDAPRREGLDPRGPVARVRHAANLKELSKSASFTTRVAEELTDLDAYTAASLKTAPLAAYFCAEFGLDETFPIYSGGLGILAGDHLKEASDQGWPTVAVGLFYRKGFFHQMVDWEGRQEHAPRFLDPVDYPIARVANPATGEPLTVSLAFPGRSVTVGVWCADVGRIPLLLLDTDLPENSPEDRVITSQLYTSGRDMRLHQETVLGVGGARVLALLDISPDIWHLNEGHSALLLVERVRALTASGMNLKAALVDVRSRSVLTIHTPVAAGNERFGMDHVIDLLTPIMADCPFGAKHLQELGLGADGDPAMFDLTGFALRLCRGANGVSRLHGHTADGTWHKMAGFRLTGITNGVHMPTWLGPEVRVVLESAGASFDPATALELGPDLGADERPRWSGIAQVTDADLWAAHQTQKRRLIEFARERLFSQRARHGEGPAELRAWREVMDEDALVIGFARRFATYKRAHLVFHDARRLAKLLNAEERPVYIVFAGKAHPADRAGQSLIAKVAKLAAKKAFRGRVLLLEEYDMATGRHLVQGVDVWLNNPRRPLEASGTSGMKAAANGVPNVSVLDGWWDEAHRGGKHPNGFAIGGRKTVSDERKQDIHDAEALYRILEEEVIPRYFHRNEAGIPTKWLEVMRASIATSVWAYSTARMLADYQTELYRPKPVKSAPKRPD